MSESNVVGLYDKLLALPPSEWYELTLDCDKIVYARLSVRIELSNPADELFVLCPDCKIKKYRDLTLGHITVPTAWRKIIDVNGVTNEFVSDVQTANAFVMQGHIMRLSGELPPTNNARIIPFPYREQH